MSVALIGSSGGGAATLGHTDSAKFLDVICNEISKVQGLVDGRHKPSLARALYTSLHGGGGFDHANEEIDKATLYSIDNRFGGNIEAIKTGLLRTVNLHCANLDQELAKSIRKGDIQGLICISCNVMIHEATLQAASEMKIPVTGSGGTSLSIMSSKLGICLVGNAGGSVATTSYTRAVSYTYALSTAWRQKYIPHTSESFPRPRWKSILDSCLPVFWAVALGCRILELFSKKQPQEMWIENHILDFLRNQALPVTCCIIFSTSLKPEYESIVLMSSSIAGCVCQKSILRGLLAGWLIALSMDRVLYQCLVWNIPATMTNLILAGGIGVVVSVLISPFIPYMQLTTEWVRWIVHFPMNGVYSGFGFIIGIMFCYGSKVGYYHSIFLPVILIEMELGSPSLWGAIDMATLVMVSAGICAGNLLVSPEEGNESLLEIKTICSRGLRINFLYGDFIEVAYPFMEKSRLINFVGYLASGLATELLTGESQKVLSSAYLPVFISIMIAEDWFKVSIAYATAFFITLLGTIINNKLVRRTFSNSPTLKKE